MNLRAVTERATALRALLNRQLPAFAEPGRDYFLSRWLFLRFLGLIYFIAFVSLWVQIDGLVGSNGILPARQFIDAAREQLGPGGFWRAPTLCWLNASDGFLHFLCFSGVVCAVLAMAGVAPQFAFALLWLLYLSLGTVGQDFLSFQWDILLLETGFLAIFFAPRAWRPGLGRETPPPRIVLWLLRWLLFRLMFLSGAVKLLSEDAAWWSLAALDFHYETQPLPTWLGWYAHQLPSGAQKFSVFVMFIIELGGPFLILLGRRARLVAAATFAAFMILIGLTGNYCFFNLLTIALCIPLVDDTAWRRRIPRKFASSFVAPAAAPSLSLVRLSGTALLAAVVLFVSNAQMAFRLWPWEERPPQSLLRPVRLVSPFRSINAYGLFAVMTTTRPEIIIEGSHDGVNWRAYEFKWKPGGLKSRPRFVEPHQPRLDWQMWFAALGDYRGNPWFVNLVVRLLQGSPDVLGLLEHNPFPDAPPRYIRAVLHEYHFTDSATRRATGQWWTREPKGLYLPPISLNPASNRDAGARP
ncbi:MAG: lipase maturation factor family protein [Verrucomicrobiota bacterium]